jgi:hypothetical protein
MAVQLIAIGGDTAADSKTTRAYSPAGTLLWSADHGTYVYDVAVDAEGNVYTTGEVAPDGKTTRKYNSSGVLQWSIAADFYDVYTYAIAVDSSGNVYVGGEQSETDLKDIRKYNSSGALQWSISLTDDTIYDPETYWVGSYYLAVDSEDNIYVTGEIYSAVDNIFVRKFNSSGTFLWTALGTFPYHPGAVAIDTAGYVYVDGVRANPSAYSLYKYTTGGASTWSVPVTAGITGLAIDVNSNVYASGHIGVAKTLTKYNSSGSVVWDLTQDETEWDVAVDFDGYAYTAGKRGASLVTVRKYNSSGVVQWEKDHGADVYTIATNAYTIEEEPGPIQELGTISLPYPKPGTPKKASKTRVVDRAIGAGALIYDTRKREYDLSFTWEPVTTEQREDLKEAYLSAYNSKVLFTDQDDTVYTVYTDNWKSKYLARSDTTYLYSISFNLVGTSS